MHLQESGADPQRSSELAQLVADTRVLGDVVTDLLTSAQLQHHSPLGEDIDIVALCEAVVASMTPYASQHDVRLQAQVLGPPGRAYLVRGAPTALRRAVSALVDNAIAHSPVAETVTVTVRWDDQDVCVDVRDNGDGLAPSAAAQLTERFARGSSTGDGRRFGLSLALVDEVVRAHRGRLDIDGTPRARIPFHPRHARHGPVNERRKRCGWRPVAAAPDCAPAVTRCRRNAGPPHLECPTISRGYRIPRKRRSGETN